MGRKPYKRMTPSHIVENVIEQNDIIEDSIIFEEKDKTIDKIIEKPIPLHKVQVEHSSLRRRSKPSLEGEVIGYITDKGIYDIYAETSGWGKLQDGSWIMLQYTSKIKK